MQKRKEEKIDPLLNSLGNLVAKDIKKMLKSSSP